MFCRGCGNEHRGTLNYKSQSESYVFLFERDCKSTRRRRRHFFIHPIIEVDGGKANASWMLNILHLDPKGEKAQDCTQGLY